jgi:hypothetical protein
MGSRLTSLFLILALALSGSSAEAATKKPTPKPSVKVTAKGTAKAKATVKAKPSAKTSVKPTTKSSAKPTVNSSAKPSVKNSAKPTATKKPVVKKPAVKRKPRKKIRVSPSPKPSWPPQGFSAEGEVYAKVPTASELVGLISANASLGRQIKQCTTYICGSVQVASETGCIWWEVLSVVSDADGKKLGDLNSAFGSSDSREFKTFIVVSPELADKGGGAKITSVICHHEDRNSSNPSITYKKVS